MTVNADYAGRVDARSIVEREGAARAGGAGARSGERGYEAVPRRHAGRRRGHDDRRRCTTTSARKLGLVLVRARRRRAAGRGPDRGRARRRRSHFESDDVDRRAAGRRSTTPCGPGSRGCCSEPPPVARAPSRIRSRPRCDVDGAARRHARGGLARGARRRGGPGVGARGAAVADRVSAPDDLEARPVAAQRADQRRAEREAEDDVADRVGDVERQRGRRSRRRAWPRVWSPE